MRQRAPQFLRRSTVQLAAADGERGFERVAKPLRRDAAGEPIDDDGDRRRAVTVLSERFERLVGEIDECANRRSRGRSRAL